MKINEMTVDQIESRTLEIREALNAEEITLEEVESLSAELDEIEARKAELKTLALEAAEARRKAAEIGKPVEIEPEVTERKEVEPMEIRNTPEYKKAYLNGLMAGDSKFTECRALLSVNGTNADLSLTGYVPVPEVLETEVKNAWEESDLFSVVHKTYLKGNVKVAFELSASGATVHAEGDDAPDEETLTLGIVELIPESVKKWITISDEAADLNEGIVDYIYRELAYRIVAEAGAVLIGKIVDSPSTSTASAAAVATIEAEPDVDTIVQAVALLSGQAKNLNIVMNRQTKAAFVSAALSANYAIDVFDGLADKIIYTDALPGYADAEDDDVYLIVGDFGYGTQANFPNGEELRIKFDDLSLSEADLIKVVGRQYVATAVVAPFALATVTKPSA